MILGFTGTRRGFSVAQVFCLHSDIEDSGADLMIHGGAEGADDCAVRVSVPIEIYPCIAYRFRLWADRGDGVVRLVHAPKPPLVRNQIIAKRCDHLIATPASEEGELNSGTWATVRYARKAGKPVTIITPSGRIINHNYYC
jgi:hypothetical protein